MSFRPTKAGNLSGPGKRTEPDAWLSGLMWFIAVLMVVLLVWAVSQRARVVLSSTAEDITSAVLPGNTQDVKAEVPEFQSPLDLETQSINRLADVHTIIPQGQREGITKYVVEAGDSVFSIAKRFDIEPETVLWANEDLLQDNPNELSVGQSLKIPAVDGVIYKWKSTDTVESIARKFKTTPEQILTWPDNNLDMADPKIASGTMVMVPGGSRELRTWVVPTFWRANSGATRGINPNCDTSGGSAYGSGTFVWPAGNHSLSGNDYWSGHLGIDIAAATGAPVYAADSGVIVYSGPISGGYGYMVMIDHGNGFHTLYAHNSQLIVRCGQNVSQGQTIAYAGSTGNSTGPHLHFEIRYLGAFVNPWDYLGY